MSEARRYTKILAFTEAKPDGQWLILDKTVKGWQYEAAKSIVASYPYDENDQERRGRPPLALRRRYEELLGRGEFEQGGERPANVVEMVADQDDCGFDQPCAHGYRVWHHAVYCHNESWLYAPRKCRLEAGEHEGCPGFRAPGMKEDETEEVVV